LGAFCFYAHPPYWIGSGGYAHGFSGQCLPMRYEMNWKSILGALAAGVAGAALYVEVIQPAIAKARAAAATGV
jgi:hypothetical protein